jgi:integrase
MRSLTAAAIEKMKPPAKGQIDLFDKGYPGFAIRIGYGGAKTFVHVFRLHGKLYRRTLGRWPSTSLTAAREQWRRDREAIARGDNPAQSASPDTFAAVVADWLHRDQGNNRSRASVEQMLANDAVPMLGNKLIGTIGRRDVIGVVDRVVDRGSPSAARRLHAHLHRMFRWSVGRGIIAANPMAGLPQPAPARSRDRVLDGHEISAIWKACDAVGYPFGPLVRLLALTGARRLEIGALRWDEIAGDTIRLAGDRTKNGEPRTIPLSSTAADILRALPRIGDGGFVFTVNGSSHTAGWTRNKKALDAAVTRVHGAPLPAWRLHDLRRVLATNLQRLGVRLEVVETLLGHIAGSRAGIIGVYQRHQFEAEAREALELWAAEIGRIVAEGGGAPATVIVPMRKSGHG